MISNPITGANYFLSSASILTQPGIRRFVIVPLLINIFIFSLGLWFAIVQFDTFITWALADLPGWLSWLKWIMWPLFALTFYGLVFFSFSIVANIIAAPFNAPLASAVEFYLSGEKDLIENIPLFREIKNSIMNEIMKLKYSLLLMLPLLILSLLSFILPLISPAIAVLWMIYSIWILTLEYADFPMANHAMNFPEIRNQLASKRFLSLGFGAMVMLATLIPFVNFLAMPIAVAGATKMYLNEFKY